MPRTFGEDHASGDDTCLSFWNDDPGRFRARAEGSPRCFAHLRGKHRFHRSPGNEENATVESRMPVKTAPTVPERAELQLLTPK